MTVSTSRGVSQHPGVVEPPFVDVVATPQFSPNPGGFGPTTAVTLTTTTSGATIKYTTDGSEPTSSHGTTYTVPISVAATTTIRAIAFKAALTDSTLASGLYTINGAVATPTFSPVAGTYVGTQNVTISTATPGASLFYTTDGSSPTSASTPYTGPVAVTASKTLKAIGIKTNFSNSAVGSAAYVIT